MSENGDGKNAAGGLFRSRSVLGLMGEVNFTCPVFASRRKSVSLSAAMEMVSCRRSDHSARS